MSILSIQNISLHNILRGLKYTLLSLIENIERCRDHLDEINNIYNMFCEINHNEMNKWFRSKNVNPSAHKRLTKRNKPFWCDNLQQLWNNVLEAENALFGS